MYGIWSKSSKRFVFGIRQETKGLARKQLFKIIGKDAYKYRFVARRIKEQVI